MLEHVLVPLDGSPLAETALEQARQVLGADGKITLVSVINTPDVLVYDYYPTPVTLAREYEAAVAEAIPRAKEYLAQVADTLKLQTGLTIAIEVLSGEPAEQIVETAERLKVDAIVISTHGRSGLGRWLFGSVTQKVLAVAACPVVVVPNRHRQAPPSVTTAAESQS